MKRTSYGPILATLVAGGWIMRDRGSLRSCTLNSPADERERIDPRDVTYLERRHMIAVVAQRGVHDYLTAVVDGKPLPLADGAVYVPPEKAEPTREEMLLEYLRQVRAGLDGIIKVLEKQ